MAERELEAKRRTEKRYARVSTEQRIRSKIDLDEFARTCLDTIF